MEKMIVTLQNTSGFKWFFKRHNHLFVCVSLRWCVLGGLCYGVMREYSGRGRGFAALCHSTGGLMLHQEGAIFGLLRS